jgi:trk system potassium uptake protein TrkA
MKSILLVGLGRCGRHMAQTFSEMRNEVVAVDRDEDRVNAVLSFVTSAQIGDSTNETFVRSLGVRNFDLCVVAIAGDFQSSLETTSLLKECGAKTVLSRASRDVHAKFLLRNGADQVVYAEKEMANRIATRYSSDSIFDYIELTPEYAIFEITVPSNWVGKTIIQAAVRSRHHVSILATKRNDAIYPLPRPEYEFKGMERLIVMGKREDVLRLTN